VTLEGQFPEIAETQPETLARHCSEADFTAKAVGYWHKAGQQAMARGAMTEAVSQLRKGLELLRSMPDDVGRQEQELDLQIILGNALIATNGWSAPEPGDAYARAHQLCEQLDRPTLLGPVLLGQWGFHQVRAELEQAEDCAKQILHFGEIRNDSAWKCFGSYTSGHPCFYLGKFADAGTHYKNALSLWDPKYRAFWGSPNDPHVETMTHFSRTLLSFGYIEQARLQLDQAMAEARALSSSFTLIWTLWHAFIFEWTLNGRKSVHAIRQWADEVLAISSEQGFISGVGAGDVMRGWSLGIMGQTAEGIPLLVDAIGISRTIGTNMLTPFILMTLAEVHEVTGQLNEAFDRLTEAARWVETTHERWAEAEMHRMRGRLLLSMNDHAAAEESYHQALAVARLQSAKFWELRAATSLARLWRDRCKRTEARDLLAPIYGWFTEGSDTPVLQDAKALLDELA
jgi:predicted ATPase